MYRSKFNVNLEGQINGHKKEKTSVYIWKIMWTVVVF